MLDGYSSEESADDGDGSSDEGTPGLRFDDYDSDWFILRTKLWRALDYPKDQIIHDKVQNMWKTNMEIQTVGWPVMPLEAFSDPDQYSSTAHGVR
jgi:hypothetical protein